MTVRVILIVAATAFALLRVLGFRDPIFQAFAHLYTGGLIGAWAVNRDRLYLWLAVALSAVELAAFILLRRA